MPVREGDRLEFAIRRSSVTLNDVQGTRPTDTSAPPPICRLATAALMSNSLQIVRRLMTDLTATALARFPVGPLRWWGLLLRMDYTELPPHVVSLLNRIARAERFAAAMFSQEGRDRFLALAAELQRELDLIQDQPAALRSA
jgi:hypothetical protein